MKKKKKISSKHHCCSNVWNNEDSSAFKIKLLDFSFFVFLWMCTSWKTSLKKKISPPFGQNMKKIIMVKIGYFCMKQRTWDNVIMFHFHSIYPISFVNKFNFVNYINRWKNIGLQTIHTLNTFKVQISLVSDQNNYLLPMHT